MQLNTVADPDDLLRLDNQICFALYSANNAVGRAYRPLLAKLDLTYLQYITMMVLWAEDGLQVGDLGERLHLDSGTLTPLLKRLEGKGFVERRRGTEDERRVFLHLTPEGRALREQAKKVPEALLARFETDFDELRRLKALAEKLRSSLESQR